MVDGRAPIANIKAVEYLILNVNDAHAEIIVRGDPINGM